MYEIGSDNYRKIWNRIHTILTFVTPVKEAMHIIHVN